MELVKTIFVLLCCHLVGDYVLQNDFLAKTKGTNWYHLIVHCVLYTIPFYICFGFDLKILGIFIGHVFIDAEKARYDKFSYTTDQVCHYLLLIILYLL